MRWAITHHAISLESNLKVDINPNTVLVCLLCSTSRKLGKAIELEAIKPAHQVLSVHEKKRKSLDNEVEKAANLVISNWNQQIKASIHKYHQCELSFGVAVLCFRTNVRMCFRVRIS